MDGFTIEGWEYCCCSLLRSVTGSVNQSFILIFRESRGNLCEYFGENIAEVNWWWGLSGSQVKRKFKERVFVTRFQAFFREIQLFFYFFFSQNSIIECMWIFTHSLVLWNRKNLFRINESHIEDFYTFSTIIGPHALYLYFFVFFFHYFLSTFIRKNSLKLDFWNQI